MTQQEAVSIIHKISLAYPNFSLSEENVNFWCELLCEMPYEAILNNVLHHIRSCTYPPNVAQIAVTTKTKNSFLQKMNERLRLLNEYN